MAADSPMTTGAIVLADVVHRLVSFAAGPSPLTLDAALYWKLAFRMAAGDWLLASPPVAYPMPLYPAYLAVCRVIFGSDALMAAIVGQHLMGVATSAMCGAACWLVVGSRRAAHIGYLLSAFALGRVQFANFSLTESLATFLIAAFCLSMAVWHRRPSPRTSALAGAALALAGLVRATTAYFWPLGVLALSCAYPGKPQPFRSRARMSASFLVVYFAVTGLNLCRLEVLFSGSSTNPAQGILWLSAFRAGARLPLPDTPLARAIADDRDAWRNEFTAADRLSMLGLNPIQAQKAMRSIALKAIERAPLKYVRAYLTNWLGAWTNIEESIPWYSRSDRGGPYLGLEPWEYPSLYRPIEPVLRFVYRYSRVISGLAALCSLVGGAVLVVDKQTRALGTVLLLLMVYWATVVAFAWPIFRYRAPLHPAMVLAFVAGAFQWAGREVGGHRRVGFGDELPGVQGSAA